MEALIEAFRKACPQQPQQPPPDQQASTTTTLLPNLNPPVTLRKAAVLLPLFEHPEDGRIHCLLTVRPSHMRSHAGEVCFPGGKVEEGETVSQAAMREAQEEIGLAPEAVQVVGEMTPTLSLHLLEVTPVVAVIPADFVALPNPEEVAEVFSCPLELFLSPAPGQHSYQDLNWFTDWRMHTFRHAKQWVVWGLTAETLVRLAVLCFPDHPFPYDTRHPDGELMETWYERVVALPEFHREARAAAAGHRKKASSRRKK